MQVTSFFLVEVNLTYISMPANYAVGTQCDAAMLHETADLIGITEEY